VHVIGDFIEIFAVGAHFELVMIDVHFQACYSAWRRGQKARQVRRAGKSSACVSLAYSGDAQARMHRHTERICPKGRASDDSVISSKAKHLRPLAKVSMI
jgi:hypothetical protein